MGTLRIATYNIHKCIGMDRRYSPERIVGVLREIDADVIALQEVVCHSNLQARDHQAEFIAGELGMNFCLGENRKHRGGEYGNAILSKFPIVRHRNFDISITRREPRGFLWAEIDAGDERKLHFMNIHMGTSYFERRKQVQRLISERVLDDPEMRGRRIIAGDFNEWTRGLTTRLMRARFDTVEPMLHEGRARTFPGLLPIVHLDHIYYESGFTLTNAFVHRSRRAMLASDHLPIVAEFGSSDS